MEQGSMEQDRFKTLLTLSEGLDGFSIFLRKDKCTL